MQHTCTGVSMFSMNHLTRRDVLAGSVAAAAGAVLPRFAAAASSSNAPSGRFGYCLNTATIRGQKLPLDQQIDLCIKTGYDAIEPWISDIAAYQKAGGSLRDLGKKCADHNLKVVSAIGFAQWIVNDDAKRAAALEQARSDMAMLKELGGTHIAAPPSGATKPGDEIELDAIAERYAALLKVGAEAGVIPQIEVWGFSVNCGTLADSVYVALAGGHPDACLLADVYHLHKGGSAFSGLKLMGKAAMHCFHINDYPAEPPRETIKDEHRVYPTDGVAPLKEILGHMIANDCRTWLSLELFNRSYWQQPAEEVARTGLAKMKAAVGGES